MRLHKNKIKFNILKSAYSHKVADSTARNLSTAEIQHKKTPFPQSIKHQTLQ